MTSYGRVCSLGAAVFFAWIGPALAGQKYKGFERGEAGAITRKTPS